MKYNDPALRESGSAIGCLAMLVLSVVVVVLPILYFADVLKVPGMQEKLPKGGDIQQMRRELSEVAGPSAQSGAAKQGGSADKQRRKGSGAGRSRHSSEPPWTSYDIVEQQERGTRLVAGRKQAITYAVMLKPRSSQLPSKQQLTELAHTLRSDAHHATYIYFYATGMDPKQGAWVTAHHTPGGNFELKQFNNTLPARYQ